MPPLRNRLFYVSTASEKCCFGAGGNTVDIAYPFAQNEFVIFCNPPHGRCKRRAAKATDANGMT